MIRVIHVAECKNCTWTAESRIEEISYEEIKEHLNCVDSGGAQPFLYHRVRVFKEYSTSF